MSFQAAVGTWIAAHILARLPIGNRFGLPSNALPLSIRLETGEGLDDTLVIQDDGSSIDIQSKTKANLSENASSPLGKTIAQLARMVSKARASGTVIDPSKMIAVLAVSAGAARTLDSLNNGCRAFDAGGDWAITKAQRNEKEHAALDLFEKQARAAWPSELSTPLTEEDLVTMARLFRIVRFSMNEGDDNWREAAGALGSRLYGSDAKGDAPLRDLTTVVRGLIGSGAPADQAGLLRELRKRGHEDVGAPDYENDLALLAEVTRSELDRLIVHTRLPIAGGIPIPRQSQDVFETAIEGGSLIVIGEPGAGKTGALVGFAQSRRAAGETLVFLSVDRFPGVAIAADLQSELGLDHQLIDVLAAAPGTARKLLIIDALDAARGGPAEGVFAQLIETAGAKLGGQWTIVASIRTFDLKNGRRYRAAMPGTPPDIHFSDPALTTVRHFRVPQLSDDDLSRAGTAAPALETLLSVAPNKLRELLRNVFNLSLAAQLLTDGASPESIRSVSTQSDLIDAYEDLRLVNTALRRAAAATVEAILQRRRIAIRKVDVTHDSLDEVIQSGVLTDAGDLVRFSHHVLFDHVAGRFFLEWTNPSRLIGQLGGDSSVALLLAPALRFAVERLWRNDTEGKGAVWRFLADIYANRDVDPVLGNVALRTVTESVSESGHIAGLKQLIAERAADEPLATMLSRLARFVGLTVDSSGSTLPSAAVSWATVAEVALKIGRYALADSARFILHTLFDKGDLTDPALASVFGRAARDLLEMAWSHDPPMQQTATSAIRFVGKSFSSDPAASRAILGKALRDPHFSENADREATWIAEQIVPIARSDPDFAIEIFRTLYSRDITDESTSYLGGRPSRIMTLSSNRRQDYRQCRYNLGRKTGRLLDLFARSGTRMVIEAAIGTVDRDTLDKGDRKKIDVTGRPTFDLIGHEHAFNSWENPDQHAGNQEDDVLGNYVKFLRNCSTAAFAESIEAAALGYSSPALWARLLGIGAERVADLADLLWPFATTPALLGHEDTVRDAVHFLAAAYPRRSIAEREAFEIEALRADLFTDEREQRWWRRVMGRLLSLVDDTLLASDAMRALRNEMANANELVGNHPLRSMTTGWGPAGSVTRGLLARQGVDVETGIDARMVAQSEALYTLLRQARPESRIDALAALWAETEATIALFDAHVDELDKNVERPVWASVSNAIEHIAGSAAYDPGNSGLPTIDALLVVLRRLWSTYGPIVRMNDEGKPSWQNWNIHVDAADAYVHLADRFGSERVEIVEMFSAILASPVPQVRLQVSQNLQVLSRINPEYMWSLAEQIAIEELDDDTLGSFLHNVVSRLLWQDVERSEAIIETVRDRRPSSQHEGETGRDNVSSALGGLTAQLWVGKDRPKAFDWLIAWAGEPAANSNLLTSFLSSLRAAFYARYASGDNCDIAMSERAQRAAMVILTACLSTATESVAAASSQDTEGEARDAAVARYRAAEAVIGNLMNQLYFGSGAFAERKKEASIGLTSPHAMRQFLGDYRPVLELLAHSHEPSTHHHLIELYEYVIPGDPAGVFDSLHALLLGPGAREEYHYESLGNAVVVRVITRYIADYRSIFEDETRRRRLVEILRLFSDVGWPEALKLLYDLPELLR